MFSWFKLNQSYNPSNKRSSDLFLKDCDWEFSFATLGSFCGKAINFSINHLCAVHFMRESKLGLHIELSSLAKDTTDNRLEDDLRIKFIGS